MTVTQDAPIHWTTFSGAEALLQAGQVIEAHDTQRCDVWVAGEGTLHRSVRIPATGHLSR